MPSSLLFVRVVLKLNKSQKININSRLKLLCV